MKGRPNLTTVTFCKWVNECFLPNSTLEPGFPHKISLETARLWLHHLGFEVLTVRKGIFIDGHERPDVIDARKLFLRKMTKIGFLHFTNAPTGVMRALPDVDALTSDSVTVENIRNHFRKVRHYMFCYLEDLTPGKELDQAVLKHKTAIKSHRRIGMNE